MSKRRQRLPVRLGEFDVLLLGVAERPNLVTLDPNRRHLADHRIMEGRASRTSLNEKLGNRIDRNADNRPYRRSLANHREDLDTRTQRKFVQVCYVTSSLPHTSHMALPRIFANGELRPILMRAERTAELKGAFSETLGMAPEFVHATSDPHRDGMSTIDLLIGKETGRKLYEAGELLNSRPGFSGVTVDRDRRNLASRQEDWLEHRVQLKAAHPQSVARVAAWRRWFR
jgi:hypothetical protein